MSAPASSSSASQMPVPQMPTTKDHVIQSILQTASMLATKGLSTKGEPFTSQNGLPSLSSFEALFMIIQKEMPTLFDTEKSNFFLDQFNLLYSLPLNEETFRAVYILRNILYNVLTQHHKSSLWTYNPSKVAALTKSLANKDKSKPVTVTMTTCKRMDLFSRTVNSMIECITDLDTQVYEWIVVDDNSSPNERNLIKQLYPFIRLIEKTPDQKGHPKSMNIIQQEVSTPYIFHIEDDWEFFIHRPYCSMLLHVIRAEPGLKQALVNINYTEDPHTANTIWGAQLKNHKDPIPFVSRYFVHRYFTGLRLEEENRKLNSPNSMYWPHFSFRVGLTDTSVFSQLGAFSETADHFEMEYAHRYVNAGFKTAFLDGIFTTHIGRRTYERNTEKKNAYDLNEEKQFGEPVKTPVATSTSKSSAEPLTRINEKPVNPLDVKLSGNVVNLDIKENKTVVLYVINLKRRTDRLIQFYQRNQNVGIPIKVFEGFDGKTLQPTPEIQALFSSGDFNYRRGIVGCALSHIELWKRFLTEPGEDYLVVLEDDVVLAKQFSQKLLQLLYDESEQPANERFELCFMHYNPYPQYRYNRLFMQYSPIKAEKWSVERSMRENMGSGAGYILTRDGAKKLLDFVNKRGVFNAIDWVMFKSHLRVSYTSSMLAFAECFQSGSMDTDIQNVFDRVCYDDWTKHELERWKKQLSTNISCSSKDASSALRIPEAWIKNSPINKILIVPSIDDKALHTIEKVIVTSKQHIPIVQKTKGPFVWYTTDRCLFVVPFSYTDEEFLKSVPLCDQKLI